jgi:tRNA(fMet)-specific endonuclease VapC
MIADTTFAIDIMSNDTAATAKLYTILKHGGSVSITASTIFELFSGVVRCSKPQKEKEKIIKLLHGQSVIPLTNTSAEKAGEIDGTLANQGKMIQPPDCMIASIALLKNKKVLTRNVKDFSKVDGLQVETY